MCHPAPDSYRFFEANACRIVTRKGNDMTIAAPIAGTDTPDALLKSKHRAMWALGDYPAVAREIVEPLGEILVAATGIERDDYGIDIAAGTGNAALAAARRGATVVGTDLVPDLLDVARRRSAAENRDIVWETADAEHLPYDAAEFDFAVSCIGIMFAPHHQAAADELVRVVKPGGAVGVLSWTPEGFIGQLFATMKPYVAPPPPGVSPAPLWGNPDHVTQLLGDRVRDIHVHRGVLEVARFDTPEDFRDYFKKNYGPTIVAYRGLADDPERTAALDTDLADLARRFDRGAGSTVLDWEYLVVSATRV
jgi:ubiquinone/menaquinone biosynthesis C-methylase UbiE